MTRTEMKKNKNKQIVRDMKECFRSLHLPVYKNRQVYGRELVFVSKIRNDHVCAAVHVTYDREAGYVGIDASLHSNVPADKMAEVSKLLNLLNGDRPLCGYSVCSCCNDVSLRSGLFISDEILSKDKFKRLIKNAIEDTYHCNPLILEVAADGNHAALYDTFMVDHKNEIRMDSGGSTEAASKILGDMELVLTGLQIPIQNEDRLTNGFIITCLLEGMDFPMRMGIYGAR
jgi:hypothetical protein